MIDRVRTGFQRPLQRRVVEFAGADRLIEAFDVLQRLRLRYQLSQVRQGETPTDSLDRRTLSPIDRTVVAQAVREITVVQRRMDGIANNVPAELWIAPEKP